MSDHTSLYDQPREVWDIHAGFYRDVDADLSKPWQPSPVVKHTPLPLRSPLHPVFQLPRTTYPPDRRNNLSPSQTLTIGIPTRKLGFWARIRRFIKSGNFAAVETVRFDIPLHNPSPAPASNDDRVKPHEWKAYGYWARPRVNGVECSNSPVVSERSISTAGLEEVSLTLRDPNGNRHPENWIPGLKHRALPPRPTRWKTPQPGEPLPFPWEVQLNPLLQHYIWGPSPLSWCVYTKPHEQAYHGRATNDVPVNNTDLAQPATYPFLTHMHFNAVAGDSAPHFPWPFTVVNERGIKVGDVLMEIWKTFNQQVLDDEFSSWPRLRQSMAKWAFEKRCQVLSLGDPEHPFWDVIRRCDSFGAIMFFRGIEPTIDGGGWTINFGTH